MKTNTYVFGNRPPNLLQIDTFPPNDRQSTKKTTLKLGLLNQRGEDNILCSNHTQPNPLINNEFLSLQTYKLQGSNSFPYNHTKHKC